MSLVFLLKAFGHGEQMSGIFWPCTILNAILSVTVSFSNPCIFFLTLHDHA